ncbi:MAG TPA: hypothetical protein DEE98_05900 [Elusimicrobia bacterium]|nr:MAG: hypothetical protein A2278_04070 [Elusimicrobia bacterium RIFOXYA12_FULL_49_49]OGS10718.1 MAG: hypothetical protein A2386_03935 [Elusimicrobia bacterium RIFOXYB1_FULL_48_9]OGS15335.1 MAG: hypothetical protein A2251_07385 [Elusimicrobia bacterium RIFOXYA2_FULL_47_53]OGS26465.1 MAG: hypothetical protein A2339_01720 [Elusimicrobia bacterium RIFOXYB12_FULL_50_12]OGS30590.1 MAG: hypothetical protein A2323_02505 [Elusimicrobia bacterium RIFOXYB2_FULL_46_23]HBU69901.1 hypothetical protein [El
MRKSFFALTAAALIQAATAGAAAIVVENFDGALSVTPTAISNVSGALASTEPHGNTGKSYAITNTSGGWLQFNFASTKDFSAYKSLSFWVRGASGGEFFCVNLRTEDNTEPTIRPNVRDFLPGGVTTSWKKVVIPLSAISQAPLTSTATAKTGGIVLDFSTDSPGAETVYIDDIVLSDKLQTIWIDNFDQGFSENAYKRGIGTYYDLGTGSIIKNIVYVTSETYSGSKALEINYISGPAGWVALGELFTDLSNPLPMDISSCDTLKIAVKKGPTEGSTTEFKFEIDDTASARATSSAITYSAAWTEYSLNLNSFTNFSAIMSSSIAKINIVYFNANSTATCYIDEFRLVSSTAPSAPSAATANSYALADGAIFDSTTTTIINLTATAQSSASNSFVEHVRFEHDGLSGGSKWYTIGKDTDTADTTYNTTWNTDGLAPGTTYQLRVVEEDYAGNTAVLGPYTGIKISATIPAFSAVAAPSAVYSLSEDIPVKIVAYGTRNIASASLYYKVNTGEWTTLAMASSEAISTSRYFGVSIPSAGLAVGKIYFYASATDDLGNIGYYKSSANPAEISVSASAAVVITSGTLSLQDLNPDDGQTSVELPAGALRNGEAITITKLSVDSLPAAPALSNSAKAVAAYEFGPSGLTFRKPVTLTLLYTDLNPKDGREDTTGAAVGDLKVFWWDGIGWRLLGGTVKDFNSTEAEKKNTVSCQTLHFTKYALFPSKAVDSSTYKPKENIITPYTKDNINDFASFDGLSGQDLKVNIFDVTGNKVRTVEILSAGNLWNGKNDIGELVETGVYIYQFNLDGKTYSGTITVAR